MPAKTNVSNSTLNTSVADLSTPSVLSPPAVIKVFTDGACKGNPGVGGYGAYICWNDSEHTSIYAGDRHTTNNRMELQGAIAALQYLQQVGYQGEVQIWTDSSYVKNGITSWLVNWRASGWKTASKKPVANQDLWRTLDDLTKSTNVSWHWVKGHAGHKGNEMADTLANKGAAQAQQASNDAQASQLHVDNPYTSIYTPSHICKPSTMPATNESHMSSNLNNRVQSAINSRPTEKSTNGTTSMHEDTPANQNTLDAAASAFDGDTSRANTSFRPILPAPIHHGDPRRQLIMDTETTGLEASKGDRIIEVGIVELIGRKPTGQKLHVYINPERGMDDEAIRIHGISEAFLADKPTFDQVAQPIYDFMIGAEIIAHNAGFDMSFLNMEFDRVGLTDFAQKVTVTDSLALAKQRYPGQKNTLDALVKRLNVGKQDRTFHGALLDAEILAEVYLAMTGGQVTLGIDDDTDVQGGANHANFSHLAKLLVTATADRTDHEQWVTTLSAKNPAIAERLGTPVASAD